MVLEGDAPRRSRTDRTGSSPVRSQLRPTLDRRSGHQGVKGREPGRPGVDAEGGEAPVGQATLDASSYSKEPVGAVEVRRFRLAVTA